MSVMSLVQRSGLRRTLSTKAPRHAAPMGIRHAAPHRLQTHTTSQRTAQAPSSSTSVAPLDGKGVTSQEAPSDETIAPSAITFNIHYATAFGEVVKMVGSGPQLGNWNVDQAVALDWTEGDVWTTTMQLSPEVVHEFKFVLFNTKGKTKKWEDGPNRRLDTTDCCPVLDMEWSSLAGQATAGEAPSEEPPISKEQLEAIAREREEASELIFQAFARLTSQALPGSAWAAAEQEVEAEEQEIVPANPEAEFSAMVADLEAAAVQVVEVSQ